MSKTITRRLAGTVAAVALVGGGVVATASPAFASHQCDGAGEMCVYRLYNYTGGSRAFTNDDATYNNDYYTGTTRRVNNSVSSIRNYHNTRGYYMYRYVGQDGGVHVVGSRERFGDLRNWVWGDGATVDNTLSSHYWYVD